MWLVCAGVDTKVDTKQLEKLWKVPSGKLRGADENSLNKYLGCKKGMVNYFSILNDTKKEVSLVIDKRLLDAPFASFHPMDNTGSTAINKDGIYKIKELCGRDDSNFIVHDFGETQAVDAPKAKE